jgi:hypothetical protein
MIACGLLAMAARADEWEKKYSVSGPAELRVETGDGNVELRPGQPGAIHARITTEGYRLADDDVRIIERQTGNVVEIQLKFPQWNSGFNVGRRLVRVELSVPPDLRAEVRTGDGSIRAQSVTGDLRCSTGDGNIEMSGVSGALKASTGDGRIQVDGRFERLDLGTGDGSIDATAAEGSRVAERWRLHTGDGSVILRIPEKLAFDFDLSSGDGSISVDPPEVTDGNRKEHRYRGRVGGGGMLVNVSTGDGSIRLVRR